MRALLGTVCACRALWAPRPRVVPDAPSTKRCPPKKLLLAGAPTKASFAILLEKYSPGPCNAVSLPRLVCFLVRIPNVEPIMEIKVQAGTCRPCACSYGSSRSQREHVGLRRTSKPPSTIMVHAPGPPMYLKSCPFPKIKGMVHDLRY